MENVVPFEPKARFDFEGNALRRLTLLSNMALEMTKLLDLSGYEAGDREALQPAAENLVATMEVIGQAIDELEARAPALLKEMMPGEQKLLRTANDNSDIEVRMQARVRCEIVYVNDLEIGRISMSFRERVRRAII